MAGRRKVEPGHTVVTDESKLEQVAPEENDGAYEPGLAPLAASTPPEDAPAATPEGALPEDGEQPEDGTDNNDTGAAAPEDAPAATPEGAPPEDGEQPEDDASSVVVVKLVGAASFRSGGEVYVKNMPVPVPSERAKALLGTGFFVEEG